MNAKPICIIKDCNNRAMSSGYGKYHKLCTKHHKRKYNMPYASSKNKIKQKFDNSSCAICGWDKAPCDRHRIVYGVVGGKYVKGNVMSLCPNCHRMIHLNILIK